MKNMITYEQKLVTCQVVQNNRLLRLIYVFGRGLLYRKHLIYFAKYFFAEDPISTGKLIKELEDMQLIERIMVSHVTLVKLRKFAIAYVTGKDRDEISSFRLTNYSRRKTAFVNGSLVNMLQKDGKLSLSDVMQLVNYISTYWQPEFSSGYSFLYAIERMSPGTLTTAGKKEMVRLLNLDRERKAKLFKKEQKRVIVKGTWNFNSMYQSGCFIKNLTNQKDQCTICLSLFDLTGQMTKRQAYNSIAQSLNYLYNLTRNVHIIVEVTFENANRLNTVKFTYDQLYKNAEDRYWSLNFGKEDLKFIDLELTKTVFGNQPVLLAGRQLRN